MLIIRSSVPSTMATYATSTSEKRRGNSILEQKPGSSKDAPTPENLASFPDPNDTTQILPRTQDHTISACHFDP
jgi:hypothetical protein